MGRKSPYANSEVWRFNTSSNQWTYVKASLSDCIGIAAVGPGVFSAGVEPTCRKGATAAADNGIMYFFGGANENLYDDLFQYSNDPLNPDQWAYLYLETTFPELSNYGPPVPKPGSRVDAASFIYGNSFYLYGGQGTGGTAGDNGDLWRYDGLDFPTHTIPQWSWIHGDSALNT